MIVKTPESLTAKELLALLRAAKERSQRDYTAFLVGFHHGLRASEISNLTLADLDLKNGRIHVARLKGSMDSVQSLQTVKGEPLLDEKRALRDWLELRNDPSDFLFTSQKGGQWDRTGIFRAFQVAAADAGLPQSKAHPHVLKHSRARLLVESGADLSMTREWLGHKAISSTAVYARPSADAVELAIKRSNAHLF